MQVEMNGGIIVGIAIMLIGVLAIGLIAYYIRKGREARQQAGDESGAPAAGAATKDSDE